MRLDLPGGFCIRSAVPEDEPAFLRVCLLTGDAGRDASAREDDPDLLGLIYAAPYLRFEPDFAFAIDGPTGVCGYTFGARDTAAFTARLEAEWWPALRARHPDPGPDGPRGSDWARHVIHHPEPAPELPGYPSHGHIDFLPEARGRGLGRIAMDALSDALRTAGSPGLYLQVDPRNLDALAFYDHLGFARLTAPASSVIVGKTL